MTPNPALEGALNGILHEYIKNNDRQITRIIIIIQVSCTN